jgi:hypothetical protein
MSNIARWKGLAALVTDAVAHGARAVERVHLATAARTFDVLEQVPVVAVPSRVVHVIHEASAKGVYASVRGITRLVGKGVDLGLSAAEQREGAGRCAETGSACAPR